MNATCLVIIYFTICVICSVYDCFLRLKPKATLLFAHIHICIHKYTRTADCRQHTVVWSCTTFYEFIISNMFKYAIS